jgi:hypothetical protein
MFYGGMDLNELLESGYFSISRNLLSWSAVFICFLYVFNLEKFLNYRYLLPYILIVIIDEWPEFLLDFTYEFSWVMTLFTLVPEYVILLLCLNSVKRMYNKQIMAGTRKQRAPHI